MRKIVVLFIMATFIMGCTKAPESSPPAIDGKKLLEEKCTICHTLSPVLSKTKTSDEWESTVTGMRNRGANVSDEEAKIIITYLTDK